MPNAISFRETPIAMPITSPEPHPIKLYVKLFKIQSANNYPYKNDQYIASAFRPLIITYFQGYNTYCNLYDSLLNYYLYIYYFTG